MDDLTIDTALRSNLPEYTVSELARALKRSIERCHIISERCQRQWRRDDLDAVCRQWRDNLCPT